MTDYAWAYKYSLRLPVPNWALAMYFIKPHCPWQNGKSSGSIEHCNPNGPIAKSSAPTRVGSN
jgi:hypothetical protein